LLKEKGAIFETQCRTFIPAYFSPDAKLSLG